MQSEWTGFAAHCISHYHRGRWLTSSVGMHPISHTVRNVVVLTAVLVVLTAAVAAWIYLPIVQERSAWQVARETDTEAAYTSHLQNYPDGNHAAQARARIEHLLWRSAWQDHTTQSYVRYMSAYPNGLFKSFAEEAISWLARNPEWTPVTDSLALSFDISLTGLDDQKGSIETAVRGSLACADHRYHDDAGEKSETARFHVRLRGRSLSQRYMGIAYGIGGQDVSSKTLPSGATLSGEVRYEANGKIVLREAFSGDKQPPDSVSPMVWETGKSTAFFEVQNLPGSFEPTLDAVLVQLLGPRAFPCGSYSRSETSGHLEKMMAAADPPVTGVAISRLLDSWKYSPFQLVELFARAGDARALPFLQYVQKTHPDLSEWDGKVLQKAIDKLSGS